MKNQPEPVPVELSVMPNDQMSLKCRLKLKFLARAVDRAIDDNFGYCPNDPWFDEMLDELRRWESIAQNTCPAVYDEHSLKYY